MEQPGELVGRALVVVVDDRTAHGEEDHSGPLVTELLGAVGKVVTVAESQMDAVTAVSGSGPAYFFLVVEALVDAGVGLGLSRDVADQLVVQTMIGSAALLDESAARVAAGRPRTPGRWAATGATRCCPRRCRRGRWRVARSRNG